MPDPIAPVLDRMGPASLNSDALYEIVNGQLRQVPPVGAYGGVLASLLLNYINTFAVPRKLGLAVVEVLFRFKPGANQRRPDIAFVAYDRLPSLAIPYVDPEALDIVPSIAGEVISKTNTAEEIADKIEEYFDAGVQLVWVIYPRHRRIHVYESPTQSRILAEKGDLEGGTALPGFRLNIGELFAALVKPS